MIYVLSKAALQRKLADRVFSKPFTNNFRTSTNHLPTMMGFFQPGTTRGMFLTTMGSLNTVPLRMLRMVPLGDTHICTACQCQCHSQQNPFRTLTLSLI